LVEKLAHATRRLSSPENKPSYCTPLRLRLLGLGAIAACGASIVAVGSLALARPDLSISSDPISEYVHGPYSFVQVAVFFAVGISSAGIAGGLRCVLLPMRLSRIAAVGVGVWAVGMMIAGVVDVEDEHFGTNQGAIHDAIVTVAFLMLFVAAFTAARARPGPHQRWWTPLSWAWAISLGVTLLLTGLLDRTPWFGLAERVLALVAVTWLMYLGVGLQRRDRVR
jgi:hypothetical protein